MQKVGPLPLIAWVAGGAGLVFLLLMMKHGSNNASNLQTNAVSALAPTEAEAFGTIEQQQQDVTNALTTLGQNQSYLGGSLATLTGITTQQGADNAAAFQNLQNGQQSILSGQASAASSSANYYSSLNSAISNFFNSLSGQINGVNSNVSQVGQAVGTVSNQVSGVSGQLSGLSGQVSGVQNTVNANAAAQQWGFANMDSLLAYMFYQIPNRYAAYFPASVNAGSNLAGSTQAVPGGGIGTAQAGWDTHVT